MADPFAGVAKGHYRRRATRSGAVKEDATIAATPSLMARAKKRHVYADAFDEKTWTVQGDAKLGDSRDEYDVRLTTSGTLECDCTKTMHGETRARKGCSHVLAVVLFRRDQGKGEGSAAPKRVEVGSLTDGSRNCDTVDARLLAPTLPLIASEPQEQAKIPVAEHLAELIPDPNMFQPLPAWLTHYRSTQWDVALEVKAAFDDGADVVFVDAPTGTGKTALSDLIGRLMNLPVIALTSTKGLQDQFACVTPSTRVLTSDLRWVKAGTIVKGDVLMGFDEEPSPNRRMWRSTEVIEVASIIRDCYEVETDDGAVVTCSEEHHWLVGGYNQTPRWCRTDQLRATKSAVNSTKIHRLLDVWEEDHSYEAGYIAAAFDGEGHLGQYETDGNGTDVNLVFSQNENPMLDVMKTMLNKLGFDHRQTRHGERCQQLSISSRANVMKLLGSTRPKRLLTKFDPDLLGMAAPTRRAAVVRVTHVGMRTVLAIKTTSRTYIAEGLASHNCDFPYANILKGRANYPTIRAAFPEITADDCTANKPGSSCEWCPEANECPYKVARYKAFTGQLAVLNNSYWLNATRGERPAFSPRLTKPNRRNRLMVVDECDGLKGAIQGFVEFYLGEGRARQLGIDIPEKGRHKTTIAKWLVDELIPAVQRKVTGIAGEGVKDRRNKKNLQALIQEAKVLARELEENPDNWIRDNDAGPLVMKPVTIKGVAEKIVWRHSDKWVLMSATIISAEEMAEKLGIDEAGLDWRVVRVPMLFPVENRQIHVAGVASVTHKNKEVAWPKLVTAINALMEKHPEDRILVHTVSYALASYLRGKCSSSTQPTRSFFTYRSAAERDASLTAFRKSSAGVMFAPSLDRGVDLKGDECRVVIVAKVPFGNLGDPQTAAEMKLPGGKRGYIVDAIRDLVQMTGRHVRSVDDWGVSYILDTTFMDNIYSDWRHMLPEWWSEALDRRYRVKELM